MLQHAVHELRALQALYVAGPVVHVSGSHQLTTLFDAGDDDRFEVGARRIDAGGVTRRAGAQDQNAAMLRFAHV